MEKHHRKMTPDKTMAGTRCTLNFWASIDGKKLAKVGQKEKYMDVIGPKKGTKPAIIG